MTAEIDLESLAALPDDELLEEVAARARTQHRAVAALVAGLVELDARHLYLAQGYGSLFAYCRQVLRLSEHAAYNRIEAARAARRFPLILQLLADGSVTLTTITLLGPHLTDENHEEVLRIATHRSKREVELLLAALRPLPAVPSTIRKLPSAIGPALALEEEKDKAVIAPLSSDRYRVQFTMTREMHDRLRRVQALVRHSVADGDAAEIFDRALSLLLHDLERRRMARTNRPRGAPHVSVATRYVSAAVRREIWERDEGQCAFVGADGRCQERAFLEIHHRTAFAEGGETTAGNLELRCRAHNQYESGRSFGGWLLREARATYEPGPERVRPAAINNGSKHYRRSRGERGAPSPPGGSDESGASLAGIVEAVSRHEL